MGWPTRHPIRLKVILSLTTLLTSKHPPALAGQPHSPEALERRVAAAQELVAAGDVPGALAALEDIVSTTGHPGIRMLTAKVSFEHGELARSRHHFELLAQGAMSESAEVWYSLGVLSERVDLDFDTAEERYRRAVDLSPHHAEALTNLGTLMARTRSDTVASVEAGQALVRQALSVNPVDPIAQRNDRLIRRQLVELRKRTEMLAAVQSSEEHGKKKYTDPNEGDSVCLEVRPIAREDASKLSFKRFHQDYVSTGTPVIITNGLPASLVGWNLEAIEEHCGDTLANPRVRRPGAWAGLAATGNTSTLATVFHAIRAAASATSAAAPPSPPSITPYLFDHSLTECGLPPPEIPVYFAQDLLQRVPPTVVGQGSFRDYWPSVFVGHAGTVSELHVDGWCSHFWSAMIRGRKRWTLFNKKDTPRLYRNHLSGTFDVNTSQFSQTAENLCLTPTAVEQVPLMMGVYAQQGEVGPGELLFVPAQSPHWVENVPDHRGDGLSVGLAANFVDSTNVKCATKALMAMGVDNADARALGAAMGAPDFAREINLELTRPHYTWAEYKRQWAEPLH